MPDIIAIGEAMVELNQPAAGAPYVPGFGGDTSNAMIAAARAGASTGYVSAVGDDPFGRSLLGLWRDEGVDAAHVRVVPGAPTGVYFVSHGPNGHEFSYLRAGSAASRMTPLDLPLEAIRAARILHASGISQAISPNAADAVFAAIDAARAANVLVAYDTNLRLRLWPLARARAVMHEAMRQADIALPGLDDATQLTGLADPDAIADFYLALGPTLVALTLGKDGALVATRDRRERIPAKPVSALDATGAGDAFDGNFLAEYLASGDPFAAARFANAAAALSTLGYGAIAPLPRRAATLAMMAT